jgi:hypothetical protein
MVGRLHGWMERESERVKGDGGGEERVKAEIWMYLWMDGWSICMDRWMDGWLYG